MQLLLKRSLSRCDCSHVDEKKYIFQFGHDSKLYIKAVAAMKKQPLAPNPTPTTTPEVVKKTVATVETPETANESSPNLSKKKELETEVPCLLIKYLLLLFFLSAFHPNIRLNFSNDMEFLA